MNQKRVERYREKVERIKTRASDIEGWISGLSESSFKQDKKTRLAVYKAFQELVEAVGDICAMHAVDTGKVVGDDHENIEKGAGSLYDGELSNDLKSSNGFRNRLIHEYNGLDHKIAYDSIRDLLPALKRFGEEVEKWIENR